MTQEKADVKEAQAQVAEIQGQITEAKEQGAPPQEVKELQAQLDAAKAEVNKWQSEAKGQQRAARKSAQQLEDWQGFKSSIDSKVDIIAEGLAELMDRIGESAESEGTERKSERKSTPFREKIGSVKQSTQSAVLETARQRAMAIANEADALIRPAGLDMAKSPELRAAYAFFRAGDYEEALEETKKVVGQMTEAKKVEKPVKTESPEDMEKRIREEITKKIYAEKGWNISDAGGGNKGTGSGLTIEAIKKMSPQEIVANAKEIAKMPLSL